MTTETAVIKVNPSGDSAVSSLFNEAQGLKSYAETRAITVDQDVISATEDLSLIAKLKKAIEDKRKEYTAPLKQHLDLIAEAFKTITEPLAEADRITRSKIMAYRQEQERKAREAEEINRLRMEAAQKEMALKGELTESVNLVEAPPAPPAHVRTEVGMLGMMKVRKWEVEDLSKVPIEYMMVDAAKVGKVVRAGIPSISGIRIWVEETLKVSTTK